MPDNNSHSPTVGEPGMLVTAISITDANGIVVVVANGMLCNEP